MIHALSRRHRRGLDKIDRYPLADTAGSLGLLAALGFVVCCDALELEEFDAPGAEAAAIVCPDFELERVSVVGCDCGSE